MLQHVTVQWSVYSMAAMVDRPSGAKSTQLFATEIWLWLVRVPPALWLHDSTNQSQSNVPWLAARFSYRQEGHWGFLMMGSERRPWHFRAVSIHFNTNLHCFLSLLRRIACLSCIKSTWVQQEEAWNPSMAVAACQRWSLNPWLWTSNWTSAAGPQGKPLRYIGCDVWQLPDISFIWKRIHRTKPAPWGLRASMSPQNLSGQWLSGSDGIFATSWPLQ